MEYYIKSAVRFKISEEAQKWALKISENLPYFFKDSKKWKSNFLDLVVYANLTEVICQPSLWLVTKEEVYEKNFSQLAVLEGHEGFTAHNTKRYAVMHNTKNIGKTFLQVTFQPIQGQEPLLVLFEPDFSPVNVENYNYAIPFETPGPHNLNIYSREPIIPDFIGAAID